MLQFVLRVLVPPLLDRLFLARHEDDQGEDLSRAEQEEAESVMPTGPCSSYHQELFTSRLQSFREAREATVKGGRYV